MPIYEKELAFYDISPWAAQRYNQQIVAYKTPAVWLQQAVVCAGAFIKLKQQANIQAQINELNQSNTGPLRVVRLSIPKMLFNDVLGQCKRNGWALDEWFEFAVLCTALVERKRSASVKVATS